MMVRGWVVERSTGEWDVDGKEIEGRRVLGRWAHAPSSWGMGRSEGKEVSGQGLMGYVRCGGVEVRTSHR